MLSITDANGFILTTTAIIAGNHNDAFELKDTLDTALTMLAYRSHPGESAVAACRAVASPMPELLLVMRMTFWLVCIILILRY